MVELLDPPNVVRSVHILVQLIQKRDAVVGPDRLEEFDSVLGHGVERPRNSLPTLFLGDGELRGYGSLALGHLSEVVTNRAFGRVGIPETEFLRTQRPPIGSENLLKESESSRLEDVPEVGESLFVVTGCRHAFAVGVVNIYNRSDGRIAPEVEFTFVFRSETPRLISAFTTTHVIGISTPVARHYSLFRLVYYGGIERVDTGKQSTSLPDHLADGPTLEEAAFLFGDFAVNEIAAVHDAVTRLSSELDYHVRPDATRYFVLGNYDEPQKRRVRSAAGMLEQYNPESIAFLLEDLDPTEDDWENFYLQFRYALTVTDFVVLVAEDNDGGHELELGEVPLEDTYVIKRDYGSARRKPGRSGRG